jgi:hypothetical protein
MTKPLTERNREDKGDVDLSLRDNSPRTLKTCFPSYFEVFCIFLRFLMLPLQATFTKRHHLRKEEIAPAAAFMAIV